MATPDWSTVATSVGSSIVALAGAIAGKMGIDKARGNGHSGVQKELEAHKKDDTDKFGVLTQAVNEMKTDTIKAIGEVAKDVAFIRGQLSKD